MRMWCGSQEEFTVDEAPARSVSVEVGSQNTKKRFETGEVGQ